MRSAAGNHFSFSQSALPFLLPPFHNSTLLMPPRRFLNVNDASTALKLCQSRPSRASSEQAFGSSFKLWPGVPVTVDQFDVMAAKI
ncbi:hypothetical protein BKA80DRAFT_130021 [Phyllosticta citrichinensis]